MEPRQIKKEELCDVLKFEFKHTKNRETLAEIKKRYEKYPNLFIGFFEKGHLISEISGFARDDIVIIKSIATKKKYRGRGLGKKLMKLFEKQAKKYKKKISVASAGGYVDEFYKSCGFKLTQIIVQVHKKELPKDYKNKNNFLSERKEKNTIFLYFRNRIQDDKIKNALKKELNGFEANFILEKKV